MQSAGPEESRPLVTLKPPRLPPQREAQPLAAAKKKTEALRAALLNLQVQPTWPKSTEGLSRPLEPAFIDTRSRRRTVGNLPTTGRALMSGPGRRSSQYDPIGSSGSRRYALSGAPTYGDTMTQSLRTVSIVRHVPVKPGRRMNVSPAARRRGSRSSSTSSITPDKMVQYSQVSPLIERVAPGVASQMPERIRPFPR